MSKESTSMRKESAAANKEVATISQCVQKAEADPASALDAAMMQHALQQARLAWQQGEVPVGAVVVDAQGEVVSVGYNRVIMDADPTAHAEVIALRAAAQKLANYRLPALKLYVTLEPCMMCVGAILHARLDQVCYGATDPKTGACGSVLKLSANTALNSHTLFYGGVLAEPCGEILRQFFRLRRG